MNYFKGNGMGFVNKKHGGKNLRTPSKSLRPEEIEGLMTRNQIDSINLIYGELYRQND